VRSCIDDAQFVAIESGRVVLTGLRRSQLSRDLPKETTDGLAEARRRIRRTNVSIETEVLDRDCSPEGLKRTFATFRPDSIRAEHYPYVRSVLCPISIM
jgi:hypothetical protein